ncbi:YIP1 family protein [Aliisedimentitalea scapharcae]|uniref:YIP1 family protein n=1 Tax=Aliisedimentitalea scapharcae TaxID=1524259 RepID=A0ABZ2XN25_9RHOB|nr:YIP1 family protein [Rhodobacteraceae bacterium M382]
MPVTSDITATYRGPRRVVARLLGMGQREDRLLAFVMGGCVLLFFARLPALAREAHLEGTDKNMLMGSALLALVFMLPLILYFLAWITHVLVRLIGGKGASHHARLALFWALLAASPLALLHGLIAGFIGPGPGQQAVGILWAAFFFWFWVSGMIQGYWTANS